MKKLVIVTHQDLSASVVNKNWINELEKHSDTFDVHSLYTKYPDLNYDVKSEQALIESYDEIIFQFPLHWFSTPFALKKYIDQVFTYGWSFGPGGDKIQGKKIGFAISTGGAAENYTAPKGIEIKELLNDFTLTFTYCGAKITDFHVFHGAMFGPSPSDLSADAEKYIAKFKG